VIELAKIRTDGGTQSRAAINEETVSEYAEAMRRPETVFPPVIVYYDGREYWLADGFHRVEAWREIGRVEVPAEVRQGDRRQAILHSCAANAAHGLRRTNADKRRAVMTLLEDAEWSQWSDNKIAKQCAVDHKTVSRIRAEYLGNSQDSHERKVERGGTIYTQNTANIGGSKPDQETPPIPAEGDGKPDAVADGASGGGELTPAPAPEPEPEPDPYGYARLTEAALLDTANGLRADLDDTKAKLRAANAERDDYKAKWQEATTEGDMGRKLGNAQRQRDTAKGRLAEEQAKNARQQRRINAQDAEIKKLRDQLERQEITL
jgi:hypothetical protein